MQGLSSSLVWIGRRNLDKVGPNNKTSQLHRTPTCCNKTDHPEAYQPTNALYQGSSNLGRLATRYHRKFTTHKHAQTIKSRLRGWVSLSNNVSQRISSFDAFAREEAPVMSGVGIYDWDGNNLGTREGIALVMLEDSMTWSIERIMTITQSWRLPHLFLAHSNCTTTIHGWHQAIFSGILRMHRNSLNNLRNNNRKAGPRSRMLLKRLPKKIQEAQTTGRNGWIPNAGWPGNKWKYHLSKHESVPNKEINT